MKRVLIIISLFFTLKGIGQTYYSRSLTSYVIYGTSTDVKPPTPPIDSYFVEINTGNVYVSDGVNWTLPASVKYIKSVGDFPTPVGGVITIADGVGYFISGTVNIGSNTIICGAKNSIVGQNRASDMLVSNTTGVMITVPSGKNLRNINISLSCPNGTLVSVKKGSIAFIESVISTTKSLGNIDSCVSFTVRNCIINSSVTLSGFTFTGVSTGDFTVFENVIQNNTGTLFSLGTSLFRLIYISRNPMIINAGQTLLSGMSGGVNATSAIVIANNIFSGAGTFVSGIGIADPLTTFFGNVGTSNTLYLQSQVANLVSDLASKQPFHTTAATTATTGIMTVSMTTDIVTILPTGNCTFNATGGAVGQALLFVITSPGAPPKTMTFGTNFKSQGTLSAGVSAGSKFCVSFLYDGTTWLETARTSAM